MTATVGAGRSSCPGTDHPQAGHGTNGRPLAPTAWRPSAFPRREGMEARAMSLVKGPHGTYQHVARITVRAHPKQAIGGHGTLLFGGHEWEWGPEWRLGDRQGRWAIANDGHAYATRVEWDESEPILGAFEMGSKVSSAINAKPEAEMADITDSLLRELAEFDVMAANLWERRER